MFQTFYDSIFPGLKFENVRMNVTVSTSASIEEQVEHCRDLLGRTLYEDFMAANALDMALHDYATRLLGQVARATLIGEKA